LAKPKDFILLRDGFSFKGRHYKDTDVCNISLSNIQLNYKYGGLVEAGNVKKVVLEIKLKDGTNVKIKSEDWDQINPLGILLSAIRDKDKEREEIYSVYQHLCQRTFQQRLDFYLSQLDTHGYFIYDECKFYPGDKIVFREQEFILGETTFINHGNALELRKKSRTLADKFKEQVSLTKLPQFSILADFDVMCFLLCKLFRFKI
jgi:hypothetical protein